MPNKKCKKFRFGKIAYAGKNAVNSVSVEISLYYKNNDISKPVFSACGEIKTPNNKDIVSVGQNLDEIAEYITDNETFNTIYRLWNLYHLNHMHAGTPEQEEALERAEKDKNIKLHDYKEQCEYLKSVNLFEVEYNGKPYKYGHGWIYYPIPEKDLQIIHKFLNN